MKNNLLFISAENDGITNCKAGGMGDVVRDVPRHIAKKGDKVSVLTPAYGRLHNGQFKVCSFKFPYRGSAYDAELFEVLGKKPDSLIHHYVIHHPEIISGNIAHIYYDDPVQPFYTDANTFSLFCAAAAQAIINNFFEKIDIVHLHDWHTSFLLLLRKFHPKFSGLKNLKMVYTIHNLSIQGIRPFSNNHSSVSEFYPELEGDFASLRDDRYDDCINLMAVGIRLADKVHTVSPSYKEDILKPSDFPHFIGGEGLEHYLVKANDEGRLIGILNGCNYKDINTVIPGTFFVNAVEAIFRWLQLSDKKYKADFLIHTGEKIIKLIREKPNFVCASVARLTEQKFYFYLKSPEILEEILKELDAVNGVYFILGTGAPEYESLLRNFSYKHSNFIFFNGQSEKVIDSIYSSSELYLMPSLFEPCGISQMLAMRNGQPCLAHHTGGLIDTIKHMETGFTFKGETFEEKSKNLISVFKQAIDIYINHKEQWEIISNNAKDQRFTWEASVDAYYSYLYELS